MQIYEQNDYHNVSYVNTFIYYLPAAIYNYPHFAIIIILKRLVRQRDNYISFFGWVLLLSN